MLTKQFRLLIVVFYLLLSTTSIIAQKIDADKELENILTIGKKDVMKAMHYGDSILSLDFDEKGTIYEQMGWYSIRLHEYKNAINYFENSKLFLLTDQEIELAPVLLGLGKAHGSINNKDKAILYISDAQKIAIKHKDSSLIAYSHSALSHLYYEYDDYHKAIDFNKKARLIQHLLKDSLAISRNYNDLAVLYESLKNADSAMYYNLKALNLNQKLKNNYLISISYNNIARIAQKTKDYDKAISFYKKSIDLHSKLKTSITISSKNLASVYLEMNDLPSAKKYYNIALESAKKSENSKAEKELYDQLLIISIQQKNFENAHKYQKNSDSLNIINISKENEEKIRLIDNQYNQLKTEEKLKQEIALNKKNQIILAVFSGLLIFLGLFLFQRFRIAKLETDQEKLVLEQKVLRTQMNPHFIFNALGAIQKTLLDNNPLKSASALSMFSKLIRKNFEFINKTEISLAEDLEALTNYIETQKLRFEDEFDYHINVQDGLDTSFLMIPPMLLQPFVENAIEHGLRPLLETKGFLEINIKDGGDFTHFEIIDNGIGYSNKKENKTREHATDIFNKRLKLRKFGEEKLFSVSNRKNTQGTIVNIFLKLTYA